MAFDVPNGELQHFFKGHDDWSKDQVVRTVPATKCKVVGLSTLAVSSYEQHPVRWSSELNPQVCSQGGHEPYTTSQVCLQGGHESYTTSQVYWSQFLIF
jgi:hypothetical protein